VRAALREAGDRAFGLNAFPAAERYYTQALELSDTADPARTELLFLRARALHVAGDDRREAALEEARDALVAAGLDDEAAEAEALLSQALWYRGRRDDAQRALEHAREGVASSGDSPAKARVLAFSARFTSLAGDDARALEIAREALEIAERLGLRELQAHALATLGTAQRADDPDAARRNLEAALAIALDADSPIAAAIVNNLGVVAFMQGDIEGALDLYREAGEIAERVGDRVAQRWSVGNVAGTLVLLGDWAEGERLASDFIAECERSPHYLEHSARESRGLVRAGRGDAAGAIEDYERAVALSRAIKDPQALLPSLLHAARGFCALGVVERARAYAAEAVAMVEELPEESGGFVIAVGYLDDLGVTDRVERLSHHARPGPWKSALTAAVEGRLDDAARVLGEMGARTAANGAWFGHAKRLLAEGRVAEAEPVVERVAAFYAGVGATLFAETARRLLETTRSAYSDSA
jgi:tetratricopeptide (TPR) repeat protein